MELYNKINRRILKEQMLSSEDEKVTFSFYHYVHIADPVEFRDQLFQAFSEWGILGRVYVAREGINAQVSIAESKFEEFRKFLYREYSALNGIRLNVAVDDDGKSFYKLKIKTRKKIVADGLEDITFDVTKRGKHLDARAFNELTDRPETILVDMRNHYESEVGHFEGAILPDVDTFRDALPLVVDMLEEKKEHPVVMYCTGGIRCEKASAYLKHKGFSQVYQLDGGIIEYARQVKEEGLPNKFHGKNFVFDERLGERISDEIIAHCHQCGAPCDMHTNCRNEACNLLFIQCEACREKYEGCCSDPCKSFIQLSYERQKEMRKGLLKMPCYFKKGRFELGSQFTLSLPELTESESATTQ